MALYWVGGVSPPTDLQCMDAAAREWVRGDSAVRAAVVVVRNMLSHT